MRNDEEAREIDATLRGIYRDLIHYTKRNLRDNTLSVPGFHALWVIGRHQPAGMSVLKDHLYQSKSTVSSVVDNLVRAGLIRRTRSSEDRRVVLLELTGEGRSLLDRADSLRREPLSRALEKMKPELREVLQESLSELRRRVSEEVAEEEGE